MGRGNVIDGLVAEIRATNGFEQGNKGTALAYDHRALGSGVDRAAVVVVSGEPSTHERLTIGKTEMTWRLDVELYIRHNNDVVAARQDANTYVTNIVQRINDNDTLGGSAFEAFVERVQLQDEELKWGKVPFLLETLTVRAKEIFDAA